MTPKTRGQPRRQQGSSTRRLSLAASGALGGAFAAVVIVTGTWPASSHATPLQLPRLPLRDNKQHLSGAETRELLQWARRFRMCAVRRGLVLDPVRVGIDEIIITGRHRTRIAFGRFRRTFGCAVQTGNPPRFSAFVISSEDHALHLFRPRTCRLPVREEAG